MVLLAWLLGAALAVAQDKPPVYVGLDAEFSFKGSTSAQAIRAGIQIAMDEINDAGGVLGGRPLRLIEKDNRIVPGRSRANLRELAAVPDLVAVVCGRFSPTVVETVKDFHDLKLPLLNPWAAADAIIDHTHVPSYTFRLSLRDSWAMPLIVDTARKQGLTSLGMLLLNTSWGRGSEAALRAHLPKAPGMRVAGVRWINNLEAEESVLRKYEELLEAGAQAIVLVSNSNEAVELVRGLAKLAPDRRRRIYSHWGMTGGTFTQDAGDAVGKVDILVVQTYSFLASARPRARKVAAEAMRLLGARSEREIPSPVGVAHAYDLVHILARALAIAGSTDRPKVRDALERVRDFDGLVRDYRQPFSAARHEALSADNAFLARFEADGAIVPVAANKPKNRR